jgi:hypothetical protein
MTLLSLKSKAKQRHFERPLPDRPKDRAAGVRNLTSKNDAANHCMASPSP